MDYGLIYVKNVTSENCSLIVSISTALYSLVSMVNSFPSNIFRMQFFIL